MATLTANNATLTYTTSVQNNDGPFTISLSSFTKGSSWQTTESRRIYLKLNGTKLIEFIGENPPSVNEALKGGSATTSGELINIDAPAKRITKADIEQAKNDREAQKLVNINDACTKFINKFNSLKTNGVITRSVSRTDEEQQYRLEIYVFGVGAQATFTIPKSTQSSEPTVHEESQTIGIDSVNNGKNYLINPAYYSKYGHIEKVVDFSEVEDATQLLHLAQEYINANRFDDLSLSVSAVDLHRKGDNTSPPAFELMEQVRCISAPHNLDRNFPITEMTIPLDHPEQTTYTLGKSGVSAMSSSSSDNASNIFKKINNLPSPLITRGLNAAKTEMSLLLDRRTRGYVNIVQENDISQALIISNRPDWRQATRFWKFNINGLGYTSSTFDNLDEDVKEALIDDGFAINDDNRFYKIGMTMNGEIVANMITVGVLSDGAGKNYWNLSTGEFSLMPTSTKIKTSANNTENEGFSTIDSLIYALTTDIANTKTSSDNASKAYQLASNANTKAANASQEAKNADARAQDAQTMAKNANNQSSGGTNLLRGTNTLKIESNGSYSRSSFRNSGSGNGKRTLQNASNPPVSAIKKQIVIARSTNGKNPTSINQASVPLQPNTTYVVSCYAKSSAANGKIFMSVGSTVSGTWCSSSKTITISKTSSWQQVSMTFTTGGNNSKTNTKRAGLVNNKTNVQFGNSGTTTITICGMKLERGNKASDYVTSSEDTNYYITEWWKKAEPAVYEKDRAYTNKQVEGLKQLKTAEGILKRLTGGEKNPGIFLDKGKLYINANWITTGGLKTGLLKTGVITDSKGNNKWNLTTGYIETKNLKIVNGEITGKLECLTYASSRSSQAINGAGLLSGGLYFYGKDVKKGNTYKRSVHTELWIENVGGSRGYDPQFRIDTKQMNIDAKIIRQHGLDTFTGTVHIKYLSGLSYNNGTFNWSWCKDYMIFKNGLLMDIVPYSSSMWKTR